MNSRRDLSKSTKAQKRVEGTSKSKFGHIKSEDIQPAYKPPFSPLTASYFSYWMLHDVRPENTTTLTQYFLTFADRLGLPSEWIEAIETTSNSRMGIYENKGIKDGLINFKELITDHTCYAICPSGYTGKTDDLCFLRVMPPLFPNDAHVVVTTPYILRGCNKKDWVNFYKRQSIHENLLNLQDKMHEFMKHGPSINYWNEFIFLSYSGCTTSHINLVGVPDLKGTKPHENLATLRDNSSLDRL